MPFVFKPTTFIIEKVVLACLSYGQTNFNTPPFAMDLNDNFLREATCLINCMCMLWI